MISPRQLLQKIFTQEELTSLVYLEILIGILFSLWSLVIFLYITNSVIQKEAVYIDNNVSQFILSWRTAWLTPIMRIFSFLGSEAIIMGSILVIIYLSLKKHKKETFIFTILLIMGTFSTVFLKLSYQVPRPSFIPLAVEKSFSYPSGHALNSLLFYSTISYFIYHLTRSKVKSAVSFILTGGLISIIGISRIYLGVHYPSDILAGYVAGFWLFVTTILIDRTIIYFRLIRESPNY